MFFQLLPIKESTDVLIKCALTGISQTLVSNRQTAAISGPKTQSVFLRAALSGYMRSAGLRQGS
jgi:hypothetical protein